MNIATNLNAVAQIDALRVKKRMTLRRKPRPLAWRDLREYQSEIMQWAKARATKREIAELLLTHCGRQFSADRIYRFVKHILGYWPNSKRKTWRL